MKVKKPLFALLAASALGSMAIPAQSQVIVEYGTPAYRYTVPPDEPPVRHVSSAASIWPSRALGGVLPARTLSSSGVSTTDRKSCVAAAFIAPVTLASVCRFFLARLSTSICDR